MEPYTEVLKKYAVFSGRATRREFWMFALFNVVISLVLSFVGNAINFPYISTIYALAVLLPSLGVMIRRMHDIGRSGWWILIELVPCVGVILVIYWFIKDSDPGENKFGPNPKAMTV